MVCWWRSHDGDGADGRRRAMLMPAQDQHDTRRHSATSMSSEMMAADDAGGFLVPESVFAPGGTEGSAENGHRYPCSLPSRARARGKRHDDRQESNLEPIC